jgi:hypothetical protein
VATLIVDMAHLAPFTLLGPNPSGFRLLFTIPRMANRIFGEGGVGDEAPPVDATHLGLGRALIQ